VNNILNIKTPAESIAEALACDYDLKMHGLHNPRKVYWNLCPEALTEEIIFRGEARLTHQGAIVATTGAHTARAAGDKAVVREPTSEDQVWWGEYNRPYPREKFDDLHARMNGFLQGRTCSCRTRTRARIPSTACPCASSPSSPGTACSRATCSSRRPRPMSTSCSCPSSP